MSNTKQFSTWIVSPQTRIVLPPEFRGFFRNVRLSCCKFTNVLVGYGQVSFKINNWNENLFFDGINLINSFKDLFVDAGDAVVTIYTNNDSANNDYSGKERFELTTLNIELLLDGKYQSFTNPIYMVFS